MLRVAKWTSIGVGVLLVISVGVVFWLLSASRPTLHGDRVVDHLSAKVLIKFDSLARPYVEASTLEDAFTAQGWLHGNNRLFQMELFRRAGRGHLSEFLGSGLLEQDRALWRAGVPQFAEKLQSQASDEMRTLVTAYVAGVNAAIEDYRVLPPEYVLMGKTPRPWTEADVFAVGALMAFQTANNQENEILRLALKQHLSDEAFEIFLPHEETWSDYAYVLALVPDRSWSRRTTLDAIDEINRLDVLDTDLLPSLKFGSNGWVVAPEESATGAALFAFDSHDDLSIPNLFYEVNLFFGENESIRGWSVPGLLGVINGYNHNIAWGLTNIGDTQDLYVETRSNSDPTQFLSDGEWYSANQTRVEIPLASGQSEQLTITHTRNGPLIVEDPPISLAWTGNRIEDGGLEAFIAMNRATDWEAFNRAADGLVAPTTNATYADIHGTIGFRTLGRLPIRGHGVGLWPLDGSRTETAWQGFVPPEQNPVAQNPETGFLAAANARVSPPDTLVLVSADNAAPYRITRIKDILSSSESLTVDDMAALQTDWYDQQAAWVLPVLLDAMQTKALTETESQALKLVQDWRVSPISAPDSAGALIYQTWYLETARAVFEDRLGSDLYQRVSKRNYLLNHAVDRLLLIEPDNSWWEADRSGKITRAFQKSVSDLVETHGSEPSTWQYGDAHRLGLKHELAKEVPSLGPLFNTRELPWGGSTATVGRASWRYDRGFDVTAAATVRVVGELSADGVRLRSVIPGGQAGHPMSKHYRDQFRLYADGGYVSTTPPSDPAVLSVVRLVPSE